jgi:cytochrome c-type biogenesis protein CcmF
LARPFALLAWAFLTVGIVLGSGWAYYELGWGGWWFWDPVENASLMPWLLGGALCHALLISSERKQFLAWSHLLAIGTFVLSLMGTFLVRSGLISSVHAFASDPKRGTFILAFILLVLVLSFGLYVYRLKPKDPLASQGVNRGSFMLLGNGVLVVMTLTVLLGTLYPLAMEVIAQKRLSVGPPYFSAIMTPLMVILVLFMSITPYLQWDQDSLSNLKKRLLKPSMLYFIAAAVFYVGASSLLALPYYAIGGVLLGAWLILATLYKQIGKSKAISRWGMVLAHCGLGVFIIGVTLVKSLETEFETRLAVGQSVELGSKEFLFDDIQPFQGPNFESRRGAFVIKQNGNVVGRLFPEKRYFSAREIVMTETAIKAGFFVDYYIALGERFEDGSWSVRIYIKPFVRWIWMGGLLIAMGAAFSGWGLLRNMRKSHAN